ncbi:PREDICTED: putative G3BP-like protein [Ipomoea nil]|uniref:putative G3BP-like protein n=1 Tax=Ipomoea nil TaxID=35883 RepID=UPI0009019297|nr:PREDICTED: putative G3BP-like protein [Ipomoea nil]XP_019188212.1 PREDICTED: putative G3BP-like protein [Ipomoea nil]
MASSYSAPISASQVGSYFVQQYYHVLQYQPDFVHQFYTDASSIVRVDGDSSESASALVHIDSLILSISFCGIKIKTINSLESWNEGVLVVVSGSVKPKDSCRWRSFVQTFFLAPQEKGYFVLNDVFHFGDEEVNDQPQPLEVPENNFDALQTAPSLATASDYGLEEEAREYVSSVSLEGNGDADDYSYTELQHELQHEHISEAETKQEETPLEEPSVLPQIAVETSEEPEPSIQEPVREPSKLSYASILLAPKGKPAPSVSIQPSFAKSTPPPPSEQKPAQQSDAALHTLLETSPELADEVSSQEGESMSVYVRNLPSTISTLDIMQEFKSFGRIKQDGVFLRNRKEVGVCYAFVEFEDIQSVKNAIKASPVQIGGRQVYIEERRGGSSSSTLRGGGRITGRGRGGGRSGVRRNS